MTVLGFTGTRYAPSDAQCAFISRHLSGDIEELHHGVCVGADAVAHRLAISFGVFVHLHPPNIDGFLDIEALKLAQESIRLALYEDREPHLKVHEPKWYHDRNYDIVDACELLIATPKTERNVHRPGGTWNTIGIAERLEKPTLICLPDGKVIAQ